MTYALAGAIGFASSACSAAMIAKIVYSEAREPNNNCLLCTISSVGAFAIVILGTIIPLLFAKAPITLSLLLGTCFAAQTGALAGFGVALLVVYMAQRCFPPPEENLFFMA